MADSYRKDHTNLSPETAVPAGNELTTFAGVRPEILMPAQAFNAKDGGSGSRSGHVVDEKLIDMIRTSASKENPDDAFVTSMITNSVRPENVDELVIYAWGNSARVLAEQLKLVPKPNDNEKTGAFERPSLPARNVVPRFLK